MAGGSSAVEAGYDLVKRVVVIADGMGLEVLNSKNEIGGIKPYQYGHRIWGAKRYIDIVLRHRPTLRMLGVECKSQGGSGSVAEKIFATIKDIEAWPFRGIVVFDGPGYESMKSYLSSTGKAIEFADLETWLKLFFGLEL